MDWRLMSMLVLSCVWQQGSAEKNELMKNAAIIAMSVMDGSTGAVYNTSYIFGVFGYHSLTVPASGQLVHVRSEGDVNDGCSDYNHDLPTHDWVALIARGSCYFHEKVIVATKQYNASAVIVYDNQPTSKLISMRSVVEDEVYLFVARSYGRRLTLLVDSGLHVQVNISAAATASSASYRFPGASPSVLVTLLAALALLLRLAL